MRRRRLRLAATALVACLAEGTSAAEPSAPVKESTAVAAARSFGGWVVPLLARPRRLLGLPPEARGVLVDGVLGIGAAAKAGLRKGDVIGAVDGAPVESLCAFGEKLRALAPGKETKLLVRRMSGAVVVAMTPGTDGGEVAARACAGGDGLGCFLSGLLADGASGLGADAAARFYGRSCDEGFADGCSALGEAHRDGRGAARDDKKSADAFHRACENGSSSGCTSEAFQYATGTGVRRDDAWATTIFERGCDRGSASGCYNVGLMYEKGRGVTKDLDRARAGYEQGCEGGDYLACTNLGYLHEKGLGVPPDDTRAATSYRRGCEGDACVPGDPNSCLNLAVFHRRGRGGLPEDKPKAAELFARACAKNQGAGCGELGAMIGTGEGVPQDEAHAASLYQKACALEYMLGCANFASALAYGLGVEKDPARAKEIFRRLCDAGDEISCQELARLERKSEGAGW